MYLVDSGTLYLKIIPGTSKLYDYIKYLSLNHFENNDVNYIWSVKNSSEVLGPLHNFQDSFDSVVVMIFKPCIQHFHIYLLKKSYIKLISGFQLISCNDNNAFFR